MSTIKINSLQIGQSANTLQNYTWYQPASPDGTVRLGQGNPGSVTDRLTIDNSGNVGIGTSSPASRLVIQGAVDTTFAPNIFHTRLIGNSSATSGSSGCGISFMGFTTGSTSVSDLAFISGIKENATDTNYAGALVFGTRTNGSGGGSFERMRIDSAGNLFLGTSAFAFYSSKSTIAWDALNQQGIVLKSTSTTYNGNPIIFLNPSNGVCGIISQSATNVSYGTSSDARLKENITDADDAASLIDAIQVRQFDWKETGEHQRYGFVAQELLEVAPETVIAPTNSDLPMSVDYSKLVPMLVKEIQSLRARLAALEAK